MANDQKFPTAVTEKYEISESLKPTNTIFPEKYGRVELNLGTISVERIDAFVKKYPDNPYFKLKAKPSAKPSA
jgi:hypothetical protein